MAGLGTSSAAPYRAVRAGRQQKALAARLQQSRQQTPGELGATARLSPLWGGELV